MKKRYNFALFSSPLLENEKILIIIFNNLKLNCLLT